jgi:hypothetical protein
MKRLLVTVTTATALAGVLASGSSAVAKARSGDRCVVNGNGTSYTIVITLPPSGTEQRSFALGAPGGTITKLNTSGQGTVGTMNLPANTTTALILDVPAVPGASVTAGVTTSGPIPGPFTVVPSNRDGTVWFDPVICQHPKGTPVPSSKFTAQNKVSYNAATKTWRVFVTVPGPGRVIYTHRTLAAGGTPSPLVWSGKVVVWRPGTVALPLKPTPAGRAALASGGKIALSLNIEFSPTNGKPSTKVVALTLRP